MNMICTLCGGPVSWVGPLGALTHTKCQACGGLDTHIPEVPDLPESEGGEPD